ncbi:MAG: RNA methyltransferase [Candidatus Omnitrophica bacterium]|nr:RNA methyltransferase [Candidatus Omnitrophota bacterium]MCB9719401.1 RNA methyltransferase [Candidatus Omnitrophota bacterium]
MSDKISSLSNPKVKQVVRLRQRRARDEAGLTIIEGAKELATAAQAAPEIHRVFYCPELLNPQEHAIMEHPAFISAERHETTRDVYHKMAYGDRDSGILAVCATPRFELSRMRPAARALLLVLEGVEKPGNLGAVVRTADGAGVGGVLVCGVKTDIFNPNVIRASLGTVFSLPVVSCSNEEALDFLRAHNFTVTATLPDARHLYFKADLNRRCAIVLGSEEKGLTSFWVEAADEKVKLPMKGRADSLNVSVTAAVMCYEALRQRQK